MPRKGCTPDNAACEGFFPRLKTDLFYARDWKAATIEQFMGTRYIAATGEAYLQNLVWHCWDSVSQIYHRGLGIKLLSVKAFEPALLKRRDIVHPCGRTQEGVPVVVTPKEITILFKEIVEFVAQIHGQLCVRAIPSRMQSNFDEF